MEWKEVEISSLAKRVKVGFVGTCNSSYTTKESGVPMIRTGDLKDQGIDYSSLKYVTKEFHAKNKKSQLHKDDILIARHGDNGKACIYDSDQEANCLNVVIIEPDPLKVDARFLYYAINCPCNQARLKSTTVGSVQSVVNTKVVSSFILRVPSSIDDQRRISSILSSLDRKIELNNKINATLEEMAQALFKSWFVDFEPFKNGKFIETEIGKIPEGWRVGTYSQIIEGTIAGDWGKETPQGNYTHEVACVRGCDFQDIANGVRGKTPQRFILEKNYQTKKLADKDILVEISGGTATVSTGRISLVSESLLQQYNHDIVCTNFCKVIRPRQGYSAYINYSWQHKYKNKVMFGYENGTSGIKNFAIKDFLEKELVLIPKQEDIVAFQALIDNLQKKIQKNGAESTTLTHLRDTLLPRLMSGEIEL